MTGNRARDVFGIMIGAFIGGVGHGTVEDIVVAIIDVLASMIKTANFQEKWQNLRNFPL